jgi:hypothetical protein
MAEQRTSCVAAGAGGRRPKERRPLKSLVGSKCMSPFFCVMLRRSLASLWSPRSALQSSPRRGRVITSGRCVLVESTSCIPIITAAWPRNNIGAVRACGVDELHSNCYRRDATHGCIFLEPASRCISTDGSCCLWAALAVLKIDIAMNTEAMSAYMYIHKHVHIYAHASDGRVLVESTSCILMVMQTCMHICACVCV